MFQIEYTIFVYCLCDEVRPSRTSPPPASADDDRRSSACRPRGAAFFDGKWESARLYPQGAGLSSRYLAKVGSGGALTLDLPKRGESRRVSSR